MSVSKQSKAPGKPRGIRRDRDCRSCKVRGVKCDLNRPRCLPCVQAELPCGGWPHRIVWASEAQQPTSLPESGCEERVGAGRYATAEPVLPTTSSSSTGLDEPTAVPRSWTDWGARSASSSTPSIPSDGLNGYVTTASQQYSLAQRLSALFHSLQSAQQPTGTDGNELRLGVSADKASRLVPQIDAYFQARMKTVAGAGPTSPSPTSAATESSAIHHASVDGDTSEFYRLTALASLSEALETADPVAFLGIAVFAFFEVVLDAAFGEWQRHLRGARSLLDHHCRRREELESLSCRLAGFAELLAYFAWWDVIGTVIRRLSGHSSEDERLIFLDWHRITMSNDFFNTVGCPSETFKLFISLAKTASWSVKPQDNVSAGDESKYIQAIGQLLLLNSDTTDCGKCSDTWRCAAAIAVLTWSYSPDSPGLSIAESTKAALEAAVDRICEVLADVSPCSRFFTHMATPAFFAGLNATSLWHCDVLRMYWGRCRIGEHPRYCGARAECEERWKLNGIV